MLADFHFLRPEWLLAIPLVAIILVIFYRRSRQSIGWEKVCDPALLNFQLTRTRDTGGSSSRLLLWLVPLMFLITVVALAGPSWQKKNQPIFQKDSALVMVLDLSLSMNARDIKPSRLERAKLKIIDILKQKKEGQTALVAYAGDAHTVSPLTIDNKTIISLLPALDSSIMPLSGSHIVDAIKTARELLVNAGYTRGDILLFTDGIDTSEQQKMQQLVKQLEQQGYHTSIIGIGTQAGSPIPIPGQGGFIKDRSGQVILSKLDEQPLKEISKAGGGFYHRLSLDDSDFKDILEQKFIDNDRVKQQDDQLEQWIDAGAYVTLLVIPLALFMFRRGVLSLLLGSLLVSSFLLPVFYSAPVMAETSSETPPDEQLSKSRFNWNDLWLTPDQQADKSFQAQNYQQAAKTFNDPLWKASANYRAGNYEQALQQYSQFDTADALYNKGNALANLQKFPEAIKAYEQALKHNPELNDAKKNLEYLKKLLEQQKQQSGQNSKDKQDQKNQSEQQDSQPNQQSDKSGNKQDSQSGGDSEQQDKEQQNDAQKNQGQSENSDSESDSEQKSSEQEQNKKQEQEGQSSKQEQQASQQQPENAQQDNKEQKSEQAQQPDSAEDIEKARQQAAQAAQSRPEQSEQKDKDNNQHKEQSQAPADVMSQLNQEEQQSMKQWLQRIPDNPGELLRIKFRNNTLIKQRQQKNPQHYEGNPW